MIVVRIIFYKKMFFKQANGGVLGNSCSYLPANKASTRQRYFLEQFV